MTSTMATPRGWKKYIIMESLNMTPTMATPRGWKEMHFHLRDGQGFPPQISPSQRKNVLIRAFTSNFSISEKNTLTRAFTSNFSVLEKNALTRNLHDDVTPSEAPSTGINLLTSSSKVAFVGLSDSLLVVGHRLHNPFQDPCLDLSLLKIYFLLIHLIQTLILMLMLISFPPKERLYEFQTLNL